MLQVLYADDHIPPAGLSEAEVLLDRKAHLAKHFNDPGWVRAALEFYVPTREVVQALRREAGIELTTASTFKEAQQLIMSKSPPFDLAIIDLGWFTDPGVPEADRRDAGFTLVKALVSRDNASHVARHIVYSTRFLHERDGPTLLALAAQHGSLPVLKTMDNQEAASLSTANLIATVRYLKAEIESVSPSVLQARGTRLLQQAALDASVMLRRAWIMSLVLAVAAVVVVIAVIAATIYLDRSIRDAVTAGSALTAVLGGSIFFLLRQAQKQVERTLQQIDTSRREHLSRASGTARPTRG